MCSALWCLLAALVSCRGGDRGQIPDTRDTSRPNIVFLFTDDQSFRALHALGNTEIKTPAMDELVRKGTTFTHAYNMGGWNGAICVASRAMMISGRSIWRAEEVSKSYAQNEKTGETWPKLMEQAGYETYMTGKWHIPVPPEALFNHVRDVLPGMPADTALGYNRPQGVNDTLWQPWNKELKGYWEGGTHWSERVRKNAVDFIDAAAGKEAPFFMYIAFNAPHDPRQAPESYVRQYDPEQLAVPESFVPEYPYAVDMGAGPDLRDEALAPFPRTGYAVRVHRQEYYALTTHLDTQIGLIIQRLNEHKLLENTYIFLTSDHGLAIGEHGLLGKQNMYDHSLRVPFVLAGPGVGKGTKVAADIYIQDAMATALELAGAPKPTYVEFNSLLSLAADGGGDSHYPAIYGCYERTLQRMIRKDGYKLIVYPGIGKLLLYDLRADPLELHDIANAPAQAKRVRALFDELAGLQQAMGDPLRLAAPDYFKAP